MFPCDSSQREVKDILMKETLDAWSRHFPDRIKVVYCVGSRWANVHMGAKTKGEYAPPPKPKGFDELAGAELVSKHHILYY